MKVLVNQARTPQSMTTARHTTANSRNLGSRSLPSIESLSIASPQIEWPSGLSAERVVSRPILESIALDMRSEYQADPLAAAQRDRDRARARDANDHQDSNRLKLVQLWKEPFNTPPEQIADSCNQGRPNGGTDDIEHSKAPRQDLTQYC